jgi:6-phosphogluconolactonase
MMLAQRTFSSGHLLAAALADAVARDLRLAIVERGAALLAVSGGTTPRAFFSTLAQRLLAWDRVTVTLVDERWVPESHARSNSRLVREALLQARARDASFVSLYAASEGPEHAVPEVSARIARLGLPFDAVVLGMGEDGHIASLFGAAARFSDAVDPHTSALVLPMHTAGGAEPRISMSLRTLLHTRSLYLHIEGAGKLATLTRALHDGPIEEAPIRAVLRQARVPLRMFWAPTESVA